jgi:hypothetical protein
MPLDSAFLKPTEARTRLNIQFLAGLTESVFEVAVQKTQLNLIGSEEFHAWQGRDRLG